MGHVKLVYTSQFCLEIKEIWKKPLEICKSVGGQAHGFGYLLSLLNRQKIIECLMSIHGLSHSLQKMSCDLLGLNVN